jgi:ribonuclease HI
MGATIISIALYPTPREASMAQHRTLIIETDGASRGNPGLAGAGVIIKDEHDHRIDQIGTFLGSCTNNQAEYKALIEGLKAARDRGAEDVTIRMDSELVVRQMNGVYKVRNPQILELYSRAMELVNTLPSVKFVHIPREQNPGADQVANMAIDARMLRGRAADH